MQLNFLFCLLFLCVMCQMWCQVRPPSPLQPTISRPCPQSKPWPQTQTAAASTHWQDLWTRITEHFPHISPCLPACLPSPVFTLQTSVALFRHGICNIGEVSNLLKWQHNLSDIGQFYISVFMDSNQQTWHAWILSALPLVKRKHILERVVLKQGYSVCACAAEKNLPTQAPKQIFLHEWE